MAITTFLNRKGGVGKTSSCFHIAGTLARAGHSVLLIDADPQASLTGGFWGPQAVLALRADRTIAAVFSGDGVIPSTVLAASGIERITLLPGSPALADANMRPRADWGGDLHRLREFLEEVTGDFNHVLIDCPPNLHLLSYAALTASDALVVPVQPEDFGSQGLKPVREAVAAVQAGPNPALRLAGYLLTMVDARLGVHAAYETMIRELHGAEVFTATVPRAKDFVEAVAARKPVVCYKPKSAAARAIEAVTAEFLIRVTGLAQEVAA